MWFVLRILTLVGVFLWRFFWRRQFIVSTRPYRDKRGVTKVVTRKGKFVKAFRGLAYSGPLRFQIAREGGWDSLFKSLGLAVEQQTDDAAFDGKFYLTCDQPMLGEVLGENAPARKAVDTLFGSNIRRVFTDGAYLWAEIRKEKHDEAGVLKSLHILRHALLEADPSHARSMLDAFFWKAVAVESLIWSIAAYGLLALPELGGNRTTLYPDASGLWKLGLSCSVAVLAGLFGGVVVLLRGSSRGHRIIAESALALLVGVPLSTVQFVSDVNIHFDHTSPSVLVSRVQEKTTEVRRRRRGTSAHYFFHLAALDRHPEALRGKIEVARPLHQSVDSGGRVAVTMRSGRFSLPWIESIRPAP